MSKQAKDICLCFGAIGLAYAALLMFIMLLTGIKILKSIIFIATLSLLLFTMGLSPSVREKVIVRCKECLPNLNSG